MMWFDGRLHDTSLAQFDLSDRGLLLGDGVFDTALALNGRVAFEAAHVERLVAAAQTLGFSINADDVRRAMRAMAGVGSRVAIRTTATRGSGPRGLATSAYATPSLWATGSELRDGLIGHPSRLWPAAIRRNETSPTARLKTLGYLDAIIEANEAATRGYDGSLFLNTVGHVACAGVANLFAIYGERVITPPLTDGALNGVIRGNCLGMAPELSLSMEERSLTLADIHQADALFCTNSLRLISPITTIGDVDFDSVDHPVILAMTSTLHSMVTRDCECPPSALR